MDGFGLGLDFGMDLFMDGSEGIDKVVPNRNFIFSLSDILMFVLFFLDGLEEITLFINIESN